MRNLLSDLKIDLAVRENNSHVGSGLGGNASEFYFLANHKHELIYHDEDIKIEQQDDKINIFCRADTKLKDLRLALTNFINQHPDKINVSFAELKKMASDSPVPESEHDWAVIVKLCKLMEEVSPYLEATYEKITNNGKNLSVTSPQIDNKVIEIIANVQSYADYFKTFPVRMYVPIERMIVLELDEILTLDAPVPEK